MIVSEMKISQDGILSAVLQAENILESPSVEQAMYTLDTAARHAGYHIVGRPAWRRLPDESGALDVSVCLLPQVELAQYLEREMIGDVNTVPKSALCGRIIDLLVQESNVVVPTLAIDTETDHQWLLLKARLEKSRITLQQHLTRLGRTEQEFHARLRGYAEQDMKKRMVLLAVARAEGFVVTEQELQGAVLDAQRHGIRMPDRMQLRQKLLAERAIDLIWQSSVAASMPAYEEMA